MGAEAAAADLAPSPTEVGGEAWTALAAWAADELGLRVAFDGKSYRLEEAAEPAPEGAAGESALRRSWFRRRPAPPEPAEAPEPFVAESPADVLTELIARLHDRPGTVNARPVDQPTAVHDLSARLFAAYSLDGGQAHLAGCHFDDVPLVRLTTLAEHDDAPQSVTHRFFDELGAPLPWSRAEALGVDRIAPFGDHEPRLDEGRRERMVASARHAAGGGEPALVTLVWAKRAYGRLRFEFGDRSVDARFDGWARTLVAPPVVCPQTGVETFHLATDVDGKIAAAEQLETCCVTGHRRVRDALRQCTVTGKWAEPEHVVDCPITGQGVLKTNRERCRLCDQLVSPPACPAGVCRACREKTRVGSDDPRIARLLAKHPGLKRWGGWRVSETSTALLVEASRMLRSVQWTFDRETLQPLHAVASSRLAASWRPLDREQRERLLQ